MNDKIKSHHLERKAILYIRQSSAYQVNHNLDSQNRASMPITHEQISVPIDGRSIVEAYTKRRLLHDLVTRQIEQVHGMHQQKAAVLSGYWPSLRYDPRLRNQGKNPFQLQSAGHPFQRLRLSGDTLFHASAERPREGWPSCFGRRKRMSCAAGVSTRVAPPCPANRKLSLPSCRNQNPSWQTPLPKTTSARWTCLFERN